jgi:HK97 family phage prohead protease
MSVATVSATAAMREAAERRGQLYRRDPKLLSQADARLTKARMLPFTAKELRAQLVDREGKQFYRVDGYASITERAYEMYDFFGVYEEIIDGRAFDKTLSAKPDVAFLVNHRGVTMARTTNGSLDLAVDSLGLRSTGYLNPDRQDVRDLVSAIEDRLITEMSFAFMLEEGEWSEDFMTFRITECNIDRGDVSAVNYGANPYTSIAARSQEIMRDLEHLPRGMVRAAIDVLQHRDDETKPEPAKSDAAPEAPKPTVKEATGGSINLYEALLGIAE